MGILHRVRTAEIFVFKFKFFDQFFGKHLPFRIVKSESRYVKRSRLIAKNILWIRYDWHFCNKNGRYFSVFHGQICGKNKNASRICFARSHIKYKTVCFLPYGYIFFSSVYGTVRARFKIRTPYCNNFSYFWPFLFFYQLFDFIFLKLI